MKYLLCGFLRDSADQLDLLTDALETPSTDLTTVLTVLIDDLTASIPSAFGLKLTIVVAGDAVTLGTAVSSEPPAATSLHVPLDLLTATGPDSAVTFYASRSGAFVDLAADIRDADGLDGQIVLDGHLGTFGTSVAPSRMTGLTELLNRGAD